jgi:hypothetical protein
MDGYQVACSSKATGCQQEPFSKRAVFLVRAHGASCEARYVNGVLERERVQSELGCQAM